MRATWPIFRASSVFAACFIVDQSDWLPMMIATGFDAILLPALRIFLRKEAPDYRLRLPAGKAKGVFSRARLRFASSQTRDRHGFAASQAKRARGVSTRGVADGRGRAPQARTGSRARPHR